MDETEEDIVAEEGTILGSLIEKDGVSYIAMEDGSLIALDSNFLVVENNETDLNPVNDGKDPTKTSEAESCRQTPEDETEVTGNPRKRQSTCESPCNSKIPRIAEKVAEKNVDRDQLEACMLSKDAIQSFTCPNGSEIKVFVCEICKSENKQVQYSQYCTLSRHYAKVHKKHLLNKQSINCREPDCQFKGWKLDHLRKHLETKHNFTFEHQTLKFKSLDEFHTWKEEEQRQRCHQYTMSSGGRKTKTDHRNLLYYYTCWRSGKYESRAVIRKSTVKKNGTVKMNGHCTSTMTVYLDTVSGKVTCEYCPTHYGHTVSASHVYLSKQEKDFISRLLLRGWTTGEVIEALSSGKIQGISERMRRVGNKDLSNICRAYSIKSIERRHDDDGKSLEAWCRELHETGAALLYKPSGTVDGTIKVPAESFLVVFMNDSQADLLKTVGQNGILYYVQTSLSLKGHEECRILAFLCSAQNGNGAFLAAAAFTDASETEALPAVISVMQRKVSPLSPAFIIADDLSIISASWQATTSSSPKFVLPPWQVAEDWKDACEKLVPNKTKRAVIQHCLDILLTEEDSGKIDSVVSMISTMGSVDSDCTLFSNYFQNNYAWRISSVAGKALPSSDSWSKSLVDCSKEILRIANHALRAKRLDKVVYSLNYLAENQPLPPIDCFPLPKPNEAIQNRDDPTPEPEATAHSPVPEEQPEEVVVPEAKSNEKADEHRMNFTCQDCQISVRCVHKHTFDCTTNLACKAVCRHFSLVIGSETDESKRRVSEIHVTQPYDSACESSRKNLAAQMERFKNHVLGSSDVTKLQTACRLLQQVNDLLIK